YDYNAKYLDEGSKLLIPARITKKQMKDVQQMAVRAFQAVDCSGLARVDFLMDPDPKRQRIYLNEIQTSPGFNSITMYPNKGWAKVWGGLGMEYEEVIGGVVELALERHEDKKRNRYSRE